MLISSYVMKFWVNLYARDYGGFGVVLAIYFDRMSATFLDEEACLHAQV